MKIIATFLFFITNGNMLQKEFFFVSLKFPNNFTHFTSKLRLWTGKHHFNTKNQNKKINSLLIHQQSWNSSYIITITIITIVWFILSHSKNLNYYYFIITNTPTHIIIFIIYLFIYLFCIFFFVLDMAQNML